MQPLVFFNSIDAQPNEIVTSNTVIVATNAAITLSVSNGFFSNVSASVTNSSVTIGSTSVNTVTTTAFSLSSAIFIKNGKAAGSITTVVDGDTLAIAMRSSSSLGTATHAIIIGDDGSVSTFCILTIGANAKFYTPISIKFTNKISSFDKDAYSDIARLNLISPTAHISIDPLYQATLIINGINTNNTAAIVSARDTVQLKIHTLPLQGDYFHIIGMYINSTYVEWKVLSFKSDAMPSPFVFTPQVDVLRSTIVVSNAITIAGIKATDELFASTSHGTIIVNGVDVGWKTALKLGDTVELSVMSASDYMSSTFAVLSIGPAKFAFGVMTEIGQLDDYVLDSYACSNILSYPFPTSLNLSNDVVSIITTNNDIVSIDANTTASGISFPNDAYIAVADYYNDTVLIFNHLTRTLAKSITGFNRPVAVGSSTSKALGCAFVCVADTGSNKILMLDKTDYSPRLEFYQCSSKPYSLSYDIENYQYVSLIEEDKILKLSHDANYTLTLARTFTMPAGSKPGRIWSDTVWVCVPLTCSDKICIINVSTNAQSYITVGNNPTCVTGDIFTLWVANSYDNTVTKIDRSTLEITTFYACAYPTRLAVVNGFVHVGSFQSNIIYKFDAETNAFVSKLNLPNSCFGVEAAPNGDIYVAAFYADTPNVVGPISLAVDTETLHVPIDPSPINALVSSNTVNINKRQITHVDIPSDYYGATLLLNAIDVENSAITKRDVLSIDVTPDLGDYSISIPMLSPGHASIYTVNSYYTELKPFFFEHIYDTFVRHWYTSNTIEIERLMPNTTITLTISTGVIVKNGVEESTLSVPVTNGDTIALRMLTPAVYGDTHFITITADTFTTEWLVTNLYLEADGDTHARSRSNQIAKSASLIPLGDANVEINRTTIYTVQSTTALLDASVNFATDQATAKYSVDTFYSTQFRTPSLSINTITTAQLAPHVAPSFYTVQKANKFPSILIRAVDDSSFSSSTFTALKLYANSAKSIDYDYDWTRISKTISFLPQPISTPTKSAIASNQSYFKPIAVKANTVSATLFAKSWTHIYYAQHQYGATHGKFEHKMAVRFAVANIIKKTLLPRNALTEPFVKLHQYERRISGISFAKFTLTHKRHDAAYSRLTFLQKSVNVAYARQAYYIARTQAQVYVKLAYTQKRSATQYIKILYTQKRSDTDYGRQKYSIRTLSPAYSSFAYTVKPIQCSFVTIDRKQLLSKVARYTGFYHPRVFSVNMSFDNVRAKVQQRIALPGAIAYIHKWYNCFETCEEGGMFSDANAALADAITHGYTQESVRISKSVQSCWIWTLPSTLYNTDKIGGYIQGG